MSDHPKFVVLKPDWLHGVYPSYHNLILALALAAAGICEDGTVNGSWSDGDLYAILTRTLTTGGPSELAESVSHALEGTLRIFEKHRQLILGILWSV